MSVTVKFTSKMKQYISSEQKRLDSSVLRMAIDIHRQAIILAPKDTRALVNSGHINKQSQTGYSVVFGDSQVRYARRRHFENKKNPQTLKYLERAGDNVVKNAGKYLK